MSDIGYDFFTNCVEMSLDAEMQARAQAARDSQDYSQDLPHKQIDWASGISEEEKKEWEIEMHAEALCEGLSLREFLERLYNFGFRSNYEKVQEMLSELAEIELEEKAWRD